MAITIKVQPQEFQSTYNEVIVVLDSDNKTEPKFQYIVNINVDGVFSSKLKIQSNPQGFGIVNLQKHLESYIGSNLDILNKQGFKQITDSWTEYDISLSEEFVLTTAFTSVTDNGGFAQYNYAVPHNFIDEDFITVSGSSVSVYDGIQEVTSVPSTTSIVTTKSYSATATGSTVLSNGTVTVTSDPATFTGDKFAYNNVLKWLDVPNWNYNNYVANAAGQGKLLTNIPNVSTTDLQDRQTVNFYQNISNEAKYLQVTSDNRGTFFLDNGSPIIGANTKFMSIGVGGFDINNAPLSSSAVSSPPPIIDGDTKSYTVKLLDSTFSQSSEELTFNVEKVNCKFEGYRLMYLNSGGSFSSFNFALGDSKKVSIKKKTFKKNYGTYNSVANTYGYNSSDKGETVLDTDISEVHEINSDYMNENEGNLIQDLLSSPEVYHLSSNTDDYDTPVTISNIIANGTLSEIQCATVHGLVVGDNVKLSGFSNQFWDGTFEVTNIVSTTNYVIKKTFSTSPFIGSGETMEKVIFGSDGILRAVNIKTSSVKIKKRATDGLINYSLSFEYSNKNTVQR